MMASGNSNIIFMDGLNNLLDLFKEIESEIAAKELKKKAFFSNKKDLNLVLYTSAEKGYLQQTQKEPPFWKRTGVLTDDLKRLIQDAVNHKLSKRKPALPKVLIENGPPTVLRERGDQKIYIYAQCAQIGNNNTTTINATPKEEEEDLSEQFSNLQMQ